MTTNRFSLVLGEDFNRMTIIPCFARLEVLEMLNIPVGQPTIVESHLETTEGFKFTVLVKNEEETAFFGCPGWRGLTKTYACHIGMRIDFYIIGQGNLHLSL